MPVEFLSDLPEEVLIAIICLLKGKALHSLRLTSKQFRRLTPFSYESVNLPDPSDAKRLATFAYDLSNQCETAERLRHLTIRSSNDPLKQDSLIYHHDDTVWKWAETLGRVPGVDTIFGTILSHAIYLSSLTVHSIRVRLDKHLRSHSGWGNHLVSLTYYPECRPIGYPFGSWDDDIPGGPIKWSVFERLQVLTVPAWTVFGWGDSIPTFQLPAQLKSLTLVKCGGIKHQLASGDFRSLIRDSKCLKILRLYDVDESDMRTLEEMKKEIPSCGVDIQQGEGNPFPREPIEAEKKKEVEYLYSDEEWGRVDHIYCPEEGDCKGGEHCVAELHK